MGLTTILIGSLFFGGILGLLYYGGLWVTISRFIADQQYFRLILLVSFFLRIAMAIGGFYLLLRFTRHWQALALALAGFVLSRIIITKIIANRPVFRDELKL